MHKIDTPNAVDGEFKNRDEYLRTPGTIVDASIFQAIQDEIVHVIEAAGIVLEKNNNTQLHAAVAKFVQELNVTLSQDIEQLNMKDSEFARSIKNLQDAMASLGGPVTNYGTTTLMKEYTYTVPTHNDYYPAPHVKGYCQVYLNGELLRRGKDWDSANDQLGVVLKFKFTDVNPGLDSELMIITFASGDLIKVISQLQIGMTTIWYGSEDSIPIGYYPLKGQLTSNVQETYPELYEMFKHLTNFPDTRDATTNSVVIIKGLELIDLGVDFSNRYYGPGDEHPTTNINGGIPIVGDCYFNVRYRKLFYFDGTNWVSMEHYYSRYQIMNENILERQIPTDVARVAFAITDSWTLPSTLDLPLGTSYEFFTLPGITATLNVSNNTTESISGLVPNNKQINMPSNSKLTLVYLGNRVWVIDAAFRAMAEAAMEFVDSPVIVISGNASLTASLFSRKFLVRGAGTLNLPTSGINEVRVFIPVNFDYITNKFTINAGQGDTLTFGAQSDTSMVIEDKNTEYVLVKSGTTWHIV